MPVSIKKEISFLPYGRQHITEEDIEAVVKVLKSDWLTQGPTVELFEKALAAEVGASEVVVCSNGTAALHLAMLALGIKDGDEALTSPITFMATANCARYVGASVRFSDVDPTTALISIESLKDALAADKEHKIKVILPVHFAGQAINLTEIYELGKEHGAFVVDDGCHALGGSFENQGDNYKIGCGSFSDMTVFSFHPVKHIATGEGGAVATNNAELAERLRRFRNHGIEREKLINKEMAYDSKNQPNPWYHELQELGFNYRLSDIQAALGIVQLKRLKLSVKRRNELAAVYDKLIAETFDPNNVKPLACTKGQRHAYHLYVLQINFKRFGVERASVMRRLKEASIGTQVHYIPVHMQPYYHRHCLLGQLDLPNAENYYQQALSVPMYPDLTESDCRRVVESIKSALEAGQ